MKTISFQRFSAFVLAVSLASPLSLFAESRTQRRTSLADLARELEQVLGPGHVEVSGSRPAWQPSRTRSSDWTMSADAIVDAMNRERAQYGMQPLRLNSKLNAAAGDRASDMFSKHYFEHVSPDGIDPFSWVQKRGYRFSLVGENLAVGYPTASRVVTGWMNSPGHRANILQSQYDEVGIAVASGAPVRGYAGPLVVALYGAR